MAENSKSLVAGIFRVLKLREGVAQVVPAWFVAEKV
jgi:hypothetical protein